MFYSFVIFTQIHTLFYKEKFETRFLCGTFSPRILIQNMNLTCKYMGNEPICIRHIYPEITGSWPLCNIIPSYPM